MRSVDDLYHMKKRLCVKLFDKLHHTHQALLRTDRKEDQQMQADESNSKSKQKSKQQKTSQGVKYTKTSVENYEAHYANTGFGITAIVRCLVDAFLPQYVRRVASDCGHGMADGKRAEGRAGGGRSTGRMTVGRMRAGGQTDGGRSGGRISKTWACWCEWNVEEKRTTDGCRLVLNSFLCAGNGDSLEVKPRFRWKLTKRGVPAR